MKSNRLILSGIAAIAAVLPHCQAGVSEDGFAVLAGTTVTSTGDTVLNGNLGVYPGATITGFGAGSGTVNGTTYAGGLVAQQAQADALAAYNTLSGEYSPPANNLTGEDLGGLTLTPGVYNFSSSAQLTGTLLLNGDGNFVFQIDSTLTTANNASVVLENGAQANNVSWQIGSTATLGNDTSFDGRLFALTSITMNSGASLTGNALALNGAVSLNNNSISVVPEPKSFPSAVLCATLLVAGRWLIVWRRQRRAVPQKS